MTNIGRYIIADNDRAMRARGIYPTIALNVGNEPQINLFKGAVIYVRNKISFDHWAQCAVEGRKP